MSQFDRLNKDFAQSLRDMADDLAEKKKLKEAAAAKAANPEKSGPEGDKGPAPTTGE